ncbi:PDDEXK nuclease domain-containing protein, partial [Acinetobacter baumannii]
LDFIVGDELDDERHIEQQVVLNIRNFILQMGKGFCFIGNQYRLEVDGDEFFIDLLFFNRHLQCLVAFELKKGKFKPADAG